MKKLFAFFVLFSLVLSSCDKIETPLQKAPTVTGCIDPSIQIVKTNTATSNFRKVLLEDYTGHTCPNCPRAAEIAENLSATYGSSLVVIANHVTKVFASPVTDTTFKEEFRNPASTAWGEKFGMVSLPTGLVNRNPATPQGRSSWATLVPAALNHAQSAQINLTTYYDKNSKYLSVSAKTTFKTTWPNDVNLIVILTQDSIVSDQKDNTPPAGAPVDPEDPIRRINYLFEHIVIGDMNGVWGELVKAGPIAANDTVSKMYNCFLLNKCFFNKPPYPSVCLNDNHINVVAFLYDVKTDEILQVEKLKIR